MRLLLLMVILIMTTGHAFAQETISTEPDTTYWNRGFSAGFNLNQSTFSGNWRGGGVNSFASDVIVTGTANYERDKITFDNDMELQYGLVNQEGRDTRKSNDRIFLDSKIGYKINDHWRAYSSGNFTTQFTDGYDYDDDDNRTLTSGFLSPAYLTGSLGFEYKPINEFSLRIGPLSPRLTFMRDNTIIENVPGNYGVPAGSTVRTEWLAFQLYANLDLDVTDDFNIRSRYQMFANYETLSLENINHRLDITLMASITRVINVTFRTINVYDIDQDPGIQYSTGIALGVLFEIGN